MDAVTYCLTCPRPFIPLGAKGEVAGIELECTWADVLTINTQTWVAIASGTAGMTISFSDEVRLQIDLVALKLALS